MDPGGKPAGITVCHGIIGFCLRGDSLHDGKQVLSTVRQLAHESANMVFAQFPLDEFPLKSGDCCSCGKPKLKLVHNHGGKVGQLSDIGFTYLARDKIQHTKGAEIEAVMGSQGDAQVELRTELSRDERIGQRARIIPGVLDHPRGVLENA